MKTLQQLEKLKQIHKLIQGQNTGSPDELANKLRISRRQLYSIIEYLKEIEAPLSFSRKQNTYYYSSDFDLQVNVKVQVMVNQELKTIYGGHTLLKENFFSARLWHGANLN
jgi:transcriptional antiterminator